MGELSEIRCLSTNFFLTWDELVAGRERKPVKGDRWKAGYAGVCALRDLYTALGTDHRKICQ